MPFAFEEQHSSVSAHFTSKQKLPFAIQEYGAGNNLSVRKCIAVIAMLIQHCVAVPKFCVALFNCKFHIILHLN